MSTSICWELTCDGLVSHPGEVKDSHLLNTTETGVKRWLTKDLVKDKAPLKTMYHKCHEWLDC